MHPDQSNTQIIKNYVAMPDKPLFCALDIAVATGVKLKTARNTLAVMASKGYLVRVKTKVSGRTYYRQATVEETSQIQKELSAKMETQKLQERVLGMMRPGLIYSSRTLRQELGMPNIPFKALDDMATAGLLMKTINPSIKYKSYYWRKINAKS
ncbi:MAG: hypothetical protein WCY84_00270 [Candidatus Cloacimonadaceae bacterium]